MPQNRLNRILFFLCQMSSCVNRDAMYLIYHVISRDHIFKGLRDFMRGSPLR